MLPYRGILVAPWNVWVKSFGVPPLQRSSVLSMFRAVKWLWQSRGEGLYESPLGLYSTLLRTKEKGNDIDTFGLLLVVQLWIQIVAFMLQCESGGNCWVEESSSNDLHGQISSELILSNFILRMVGITWASVASTKQAGVHVTAHVTTSPFWNVILSIRTHLISTDSLLSRKHHMPDGL